jgi:WD40 repeat protein
MGVEKTAQQFSFAADGRLLAASGPTGLAVVDLRHHTSHTLRADALGCDRVAGPIALSETDHTLVVAACGVQSIDISEWPWRPKPVFNVNVCPEVLSFSGDGRVLAVFCSGGASRGLQLVDIGRAGFSPRLALQSLAEGGSIAFAPDGRLVFAHGDGLVELVDIEHGISGPRMLGLPAGSSPTGVAVSPDELLVASIELERADKTTIRLWDVQTDQLVAIIPLPGLVGGTASAFTGRSLTVRGYVPITDYSKPAPSLAVRLDLDPASWERRACVVANRNLTRAEWQQYVPGRPYEKVCRELP